ncbi:hybrid sensor histidine kinase/response regulator [Desulfobacterales bacterium HSG16]|nr:hybrid sensor histidine kinase/response regulator [Desulfobacterales bacterium HSG16]
MNEGRNEQCILIVDDSPENIDVLGKVLSEYKRLVALNGEKALQVAISDNPPDLILLDIIMPGLDGYEVCRQLKTNEKTKDIPVIFITVMGEEDDETRGLETGAVDYITKPFSPPIVRARVKNHLQLKLAREELKHHNKELLEAAQLREDIERITRHDLKNPLNPIIALSSLLLSTTTLTEKQKDYVRIIREEGHKMLDLINLSLDLFKMERCLYSCNSIPVDIFQIIQNILLNENQSIIKFKKLTIDIQINGKPTRKEDKYFVMGEKLLCYSMMSNLIKNAMEASPEEEQIAIYLHDKERAVISIQNQGTVPKEIREFFFDKYVSSGKRQGTGLGTYSARLIAETQNGDIHMTTSKKDGTTVTIHMDKGWR